MDAVEDELMRLSREYVRDIAAIVRGPRGCLDGEADQDAERVAHAILEGLALAADQVAIESAEILGTLQEDWKP